MSESSILPRTRSIVSATLQTGLRAFGSSDSQKGQFVVDNIANGTNYKDSLTHIEDLAKMLHHVSGRRGLDVSVEERI